MLLIAHTFLYHGKFPVVSKKLTELTIGQICGHISALCPRPFFETVFKLISLVWPFWYVDASVRGGWSRKWPPPVALRGMPRAFRRCDLVSFSFVFKKKTFG